MCFLRVPKEVEAQVKSWIRFHFPQKSKELQVSERRARPVLPSIIFPHFSLPCLSIPPPPFSDFTSGSPLTYRKLISAQIYSLSESFHVCAMQSAYLHLKMRVFLLGCPVQMQAIMDSLPPALRQDLACVMNRSLFAKVRVSRRGLPC